MLGSITKWIKTIKISKQDYIFLLLTTVIEIASYAFYPISFALIATYTSEQNIFLANTWTAISFMLQILAFIVSLIKQHRLLIINKYVFNYLYNNLKLKIEDSKYFSNFIFKFNNLVIFIFRFITIIIVACFYSFFLTLIFLLAIILCTFLSLILNKIRKAKQNHEYYGFQISICDTILNCAWTSFSFLIIIFSLNLINNNNISFTIFLLIITFISNHISKSELTIKHLVNLNELNNRILKLNKIENFDE